MFLDVLRWLGNRTDIFGTARNMLFKQGLVIIGSVIETICVKCTEDIIGRSHNFKERTRRMVIKDMITKQLKDSLDCIWDKRSNVHIYLVSLSEHEYYKSDDFNKAKLALNQLRDQLDEYFFNKSTQRTR